MSRINENTLTNVFSLCDVKHVSWQAYCVAEGNDQSNGVGSTSIFDDAILCAYFATLDAGIPCLWGVSTQSPATKPTSTSTIPAPIPTSTSTHTPSDEGIQVPRTCAFTQNGETDKLKTKTIEEDVSDSGGDVRVVKVLWVFLIDGSSAEMPESLYSDGSLIMKSQGGMSTHSPKRIELLFRALHNLHERVLLRQGFVRLGRADLDQSLEAEAKGVSSEFPSVLLCPYALPARLIHTSKENVHIPSTEAERLRDAWSLFFPVAWETDGGGLLDSGDVLPMFVTVMVEEGNARMLYPTACIYKAIHVSTSPHDMKVLTSILISATWRERLVETMRYYTYGDENKNMKDVHTRSTQTLKNKKDKQDNSNTRKPVSLTTAVDGYDTCEMWTVEDPLTIPSDAMARPLTTRIPVSCLSSPPSACCDEVSNWKTDEHANEEVAMAVKTESEPVEDPSTKRPFDDDDVIEEVLGSSSNTPIPFSHPSKRIKVEDGTDLSTSLGMDTPVTKVHEATMAADSKLGIFPQQSVPLSHGTSTNELKVTTVKPSAIPANTLTTTQMGTAPTPVGPGSTTTSTITPTLDLTAMATTATHTPTNGASVAVSSSSGPQSQGEPTLNATETGVGVGATDLMYIRPNTIVPTSSTGNVIDLDHSEWEVTEDDFDFFAKPRPKMRGVGVGVGNNDAAISTVPLPASTIISKMSVDATPTTTIGTSNVASNIVGIRSSANESGSVNEFSIFPFFSRLRRGQGEFEGNSTGAAPVYVPLDSGTSNQIAMGCTPRVVTEEQRKPSSPSPFSHDAVKKRARTPAPSLDLVVQMRHGVLAMLSMHGQQSQKKRTGVASTTPAKSGVRWSTSSAQGSNSSSGVLIKSPGMRGSDDMLKYTYASLDGLRPITNTHLRFRPHYMKKPLPRMTTCTTNGYCQLKTRYVTPNILRGSVSSSTNSDCNHVDKTGIDNRIKAKPSLSSSPSAASKRKSGCKPQPKRNTSSDGVGNGPMSLESDSSSHSETSSGSSSESETDEITPTWASVKLNGNGTSATVKVQQGTDVNGNCGDATDVNGVVDSGENVELTRTVVVDSVLANLLISATALNSAGTEYSSAGFGGPSPLFSVESDEYVTNGSQPWNTTGDTTTDTKSAERKVSSLLTYKRTKKIVDDSPHVKALIAADSDTNVPLVLQSNKNTSVGSPTTESLTVTVKNGTPASVPATYLNKEALGAAHTRTSTPISTPISTPVPTPTIPTPHPHLHTSTAITPSFTDGILESGESCTPDCTDKAYECVRCMVGLRLQCLEILAMDASLDWGSLESDATAFHLADRYADLPIESFSRSYPNQYTVSSTCTEAKMENTPDSAVGISSPGYALGSGDNEARKTQIKMNEGMHQYCTWQKKWRRSLVSTSCRLPNVLFQLLHSRTKTVSPVSVEGGSGNVGGSAGGEHFSTIPDVIKGVGEGVSGNDVSTSGRTSSSVPAVALTYSIGNKNKINSNNSKNNNITGTSSICNAKSTRMGGGTGDWACAVANSFDATECSASNTAVGWALCAKKHTPGALMLLPGVVADIVLSLHERLRRPMSMSTRPFAGVFATSSRSSTPSRTPPSADDTNASHMTANHMSSMNDNTHTQSTSTSTSIAFTISGPMSIGSLGTLGLPSDNGSSTAPPRLSRVWRDDVLASSGPHANPSSHTSSYPRQDNAPGGTQHACSLRVPDIVCGLDEDVISSSPLALQHWERLSLEPLKAPREVRYLALCPDNPFLMTRCASLLQDVSAAFRMLRLGTHTPFGEASFYEGTHIPFGVSNLYEECIYKVGFRSGEDVRDDSLATASVKASDGMCSYYNACAFLAAMLSSLVVPQLWDDPCVFYDGKPHYVVYFVNTFAQDTAIADLNTCFSYLMAHLPRQARHLVVMQVLPVEFLVTPGTGGFVGQTNIIDITKRFAFNIYSKCRTMIYPRKPIFVNDNNPVVIEPLYLYTPAYRLDDTPQRIKFSADNEMLAAEEIVSRMLHCAYAVCGPWLLSVWTDSVGELLEMKSFYLGVPDTTTTHPCAPVSTSTSNQTSTPTFTNTDMGGDVGGSGGKDKGGASDDASEVKGRTVAMLLSRYAIGLVRKTSMPWRVVIGKLGLLTTGEATIWKDVCAPSGLRAINQSMTDACAVCTVTGLTLQRPTIVSCTVISLSPETNLQLFNNPTTVNSQSDISAGLDFGSGPDDLRERKVIHQKKRRPSTPSGAPVGGPTSTEQGSDRVSEKYMSRSWSLTFDRPIVSIELSSEFAEPLTSAFICTTFASVGDASRSKGLAASPPFTAHEVNTELPFSIKLGLISHGSILSHGRSSDPLYRMLKEVLCEDTEAMDVDLSQPLTKDGKSTAMGVMGCVSDQYNNLSWLMATPLSLERISVMPHHFCILTRLVGLVCSDGISCADVESARQMN
eukprot:CFRG0979T1